VVCTHGQVKHVEDLPIWFQAVLVEIPECGCPKPTFIVILCTATGIFELLALLKRRKHTTTVIIHTLHLTDLIYTSKLGEGIKGEFTTCI